MPIALLLQPVYEFRRLRRPGPGRGDTLLHALRIHFSQHGLALCDALPPRRHLRREPLLRRLPPAVDDGLVVRLRWDLAFDLHIIQVHHRPLALPAHDEQRPAVQVHPHILARDVARVLPEDAGRSALPPLHQVHLYQLPFPSRPIERLRRATARVRCRRVGHVRAKAHPRRGALRHQHPRTQRQLSCAWHPLHDADVVIAASIQRHIQFQRPRALKRLFLRRLQGVDSRITVLRP